MKAKATKRIHEWSPFSTRKNHTIELRAEKWYYYQGQETFCCVDIVFFYFLQVFYFVIPL